MNITFAGGDSRSGARKANDSKSGARKQNDELEDSRKQDSRSGPRVVDEGPKTV